MTQNERIPDNVSEELILLQGCISGSPIPAFVIGRDHRLIYWNRALEELSKIPAWEVIGTTQHWRAFYGEERPCLADLLVRDALHEMPTWYLDKYARSDLIDDAYEATDFFPALGEKGRWLRFTAALIRDDRGAPIGAIETLEDITARKEAEQALLKAHDELESRVRERTVELAWTNAALQQITDHLSLILESLPIVSYTRIASGKLPFSYVSSSIGEITGHTADSFTRDPAFWRESIHPDDRQRVMDTIRAEQVRGIHACEYRFLAADDTYRWFSDFWRIIHPPGSPNRHIVGVWQDVTEAKRMRQESEMRMQQMIQTQKLTALGEVVAGVAHEINNPISFISYNIPLLEEIWNSVEAVLAEHVERHPLWDKRGMGREDIASHMREIIHAFKMAASRISRVISSLKEFSRSDEALQRRPIALDDVIQGAMVIVGAQIRKTVSTIDVSIAPQLPSIEGHFQRLEQVVANLLINAHQAIPPGQKGAIAIRARFIAWMDAVVVEVEDNGRGMAREILDHLFHPFFTTRRDSGGTGLGLSISYGIVKEHGGQIGVISQIGAGTKFTLFLPIQGGTYNRLSPSILCIDHDDPFSKGLAAHLPHVQLWPASAGDTVEGIVAYLQEHPEIDIVLSEIRLPALNGWDLLRGLKERFPLMNIILYSSDPTDCEAPHDVIGDARCILKKPFTADQLEKIILEIGRQRL